MSPCVSVCECCKVGSAFQQHSVTVRSVCEAFLSFSLIPLRASPSLSPPSLPISTYLLLSVFPLLSFPPHFSSYIFLLSPSPISSSFLLLISSPVSPSYLFLSPIYSLSFHLLLSAPPVSSFYPLLVTSLAAAPPRTSADCSNI